MSTFDPTSRVNAIQAAAETAKGLIDKKAKQQVDRFFASHNIPAESAVRVAQKTHEIWELARKQKLEINLKATAEINEVWADWNDAEAKERKKRTK